MKRLTIIAGHYGSGKSEFSLNFAIEKHCDVILDLDIVNPYFRSRELATTLQEKGIVMISSSLQEARGSDFPFISSSTFLPFQDTTKRVVVDLGGDPVGAKLMQQYHEWIHEEVDVLFCINIYREQTRSIEDIYRMMHAIEVSSGLKITGLINTSNFIKDTTIEGIKKGEEIIKEVSNRYRIPLLYTAIPHFLSVEEAEFDSEIIPLQLYLRPSWL
jgi:predicted ABC-type ATPase